METAAVDLSLRESRAKGLDPMGNTQHGGRKSAGGFAIVGDLKFILLLCGGKNGRKHMTRPSGLEKQQY